MNKSLLFTYFLFISFSTSAFGVEVAGFSFDPPKDWKSTPLSSNMRKAQFEAQNKSGDKAEIAFFHFGSSGAGGIQANIDRWMKQFENPQGKVVETNKVGAVSVTFAQAHGTFLSGRPFGPKTPNPGFGMTAAIVDGPAGSIFVKMTGPKAVVDENTAALKKMVQTAVSKK